MREANIKIHGFLHSIVLMLALAFGATVALIVVAIAVSGGEGNELVWKSVRVDPSASAVAFAFVLAVLGWLAAASGLLGDRLARVTSASESTSSRVTSVAVFGFLTFGLIGAIGSGIVPDAKGYNATRQSRLIPVYPPTSAAPLISHTVFFSNGKYVISPAQSTALKSFFEPLVGCRDLELELQGFVSSRSFGGDNELRNLELSQLRVAAVLALAKTVKIGAKGAPPWKTLQELETKRRFADRDLQGIELIDREAFNRRVEVRVVSYGACASAQLSK